MCVRTCSSLLRDLPPQQRRGAALWGLPCALASFHPHGLHLLVLDPRPTKRCQLRTQKQGPWGGRESHPSAAEGPEEVQTASGLSPPAPAVTCLRSQASSPPGGGPTSGTQCGLTAVALFHARRTIHIAQCLGQGLLDPGTTDIGPDHSPGWGHSGHCGLQLLDARSTPVVTTTDGNRWPRTSSVPEQQLGSARG